MQNHKKSAITAHEIRTVDKRVLTIFKYTNEFYELSMFKIGYRIIQKISRRCNI